MLKDGMRQGTFSPASLRLTARMSAGTAIEESTHYQPTILTVLDAAWQCNCKKSDDRASLSITDTKCIAALLNLGRDKRA